MLGRFFQWNRVQCDRIGNHLRLAREHLYWQYPEVVGRYLAANPTAVVVDVGAGRECPFARFRPHGGQVRIIGVDLSESELCLNRDLNEYRVADVTIELPFEDESVDAVVSRSTLEHLTNQARFTHEVARVLKPGGVVIHFVPNKFAPFALMNQALPRMLSRRLLRFAWEQSEGICGFPAYYDKCHPRALHKLLRDAGFADIRMCVSYYQSFYMGFFIPFYLISLAYDVFVRALNLRSLCAFILVSASRGVAKT